MRQATALLLLALAACGAPPGYSSGQGIVTCPVVNESFTPPLRRCVDQQTGAICYTRGEGLACIRVTQ